MNSLLKGENIKLNSIKEEDFPSINSWYDDADFLRFYDMVPAIPKLDKEVKDVFEEFKGTQERVIFAIRNNESNEIIGVAGFDDVIWSNGVATLFIGIGDTKYRNRGLGKQAIKLLLEFGFSELNFHRIQLNVLGYNTSAIKLYEAVGFKREGEYREFILRDYKRYSMYLYGLLRDEWINLKETL
ncbi:GNAT family N-acetyltransferase [Clostridium manihotivorum]|uniref:GNAT family N-acetyltransferase n=1 Tax=Clostridium manihotivorum TaxID=2320868 RepID=A0A3R5U538_9CLOT|nr:GNAT family protein [Clostridium manihotivorum]QAA31853.1 GNAT family N-acetyltransferase [Clostridium manihotivorum]